MSKPIAVTLPDGATASRGTLTVPDQPAARSLIASLTSAMRQTKSGGRSPSCDCGECRKCKVRESQRRRRSDGARN
jgi:hypothetical protein